MQAAIIFGVILFIIGAGIATTFSLFVNLLVGLGGGASLILLGAGIYCYFNKSYSDQRPISLIAIGLGGLCFGACMGAAVGSFVPGLGTILGAIIGGVIGLVLPLAAVLLLNSVLTCKESSHTSSFCYTPVSTSPNLSSDNHLSLDHTNSQHSTKGLFDHSRILNAEADPRLISGPGF